MKIMGFDCSTVATGWALLEDGKYSKSGVIRPVDEIAQEHEITKKAAKELLNELQTFIHVTRKARGLIDECKPDIVVVEDAFLKDNASVLRLLARLGGGVLDYWIHTYDLVGCRTYVAMASSARATIGCKGNAKKPEVIQFVLNKYGIELKDDNEADALVLAMFGWYRHSIKQSVEPKQRTGRRIKKWKQRVN